MFKKLKEKLRSWTKNLAKEAEESKVTEEIKEEPVEEKFEPEKVGKKSFLKKIFAKKEKEEVIEETEIKKIEIPKKFEIGTQKVEPDLEKIKEIEKELQDLKKEIPESEEEKTITEIIEDKKQAEVKEQQFPEILKEEPKPEKKSFFKRIASKITKVKISEKDFDVYAEELEMLLLENNVALEVAEKMIKQLRQEIVGKEFLKKEIEGQIQESFKDIIREILIEPFNLIEKIKNKSSENSSKPYVILFCGINGTGKTTTIAKIAQQLKDNKLTCVMAAADTFRAASIEQIKKHGEKLNIPVIAHEYNSDPAAVGFDAIKYAEKNKINAVLIDTAGRMYTEKNLMAQIEKIAKVTKPDTKIFVGESLTGNDIIEQVKSFDWAVQIDGIILSKADIDEKGGTALSVGYITKKPILYLGIGQEYEKIEPFDKEKFIEKLGLGDDE